MLKFGMFWITDGGINNFSDVKCCKLFIMNRIIKNISTFDKL